MGASFEDLVETDLLVKTDLKSELSLFWIFKFGKILAYVIKFVCFYMHAKLSSIACTTIQNLPKMEKQIGLETDRSFSP